MAISDEELFQKTGVPPWERSEKPRAWDTYVPPPSTWPEGIRADCANKRARNKVPGEPGGPPAPFASHQRDYASLGLPCEFPTLDRMKDVVASASLFLEWVPRCVPIIGATPAAAEIPPRLLRLGQYVLHAHCLGLHRALAPAVDARKSSGPAEPLEVQVVLGHEARAFLGSDQPLGSIVRVKVFGPEHTPGLGALGYRNGYRGWDEGVLYALEWLSLTFYGLMGRWGKLASSDTTIYPEMWSLDAGLVLSPDGGESIRFGEFRALEMAVSMLPTPEDLERDAREYREGGGGYLDVRPYFSAGPPARAAGPARDVADTASASRGPRRKTKAETLRAKGMALAIAAQNPGMGLEEVARHAGLSRATLYRMADFMRLMATREAEGEESRREVRGYRGRETGHLEAWPES